MRREKIGYYLRNPRRRRTEAIPMPIVEATISWRRSQDAYIEDIRIDTGADVSVLPVELKEPLGLDDQDAIYELDVHTIHDSQPALVFLADFVLRGPHMSPLQFQDVHVIFRDTELALFGIWTALEYVPQLMCDFRGMRTSL